MWKWIVAGCVLILGSCAGGGVYLYSSGKLKPIIERFNPESKLTQVRLEEVKRGDLIRTVSAPGIIEPRTKVEISAQVVARIIALPFLEGQSVRAGDVIARLDAEAIAAQLEGAKAQTKSEQARLDGAKAAFANASAELGRARELYSTRDVAKADMDRLEMEYARAESNLRAAEFAIDIANARVRQAEKDLSNTTISSPMDGTITKLNAEVGELVMIGTLNNPSSIIMEIANLDDMLVKARVDEANIAPVKPGQKAKVFVNAYPNLNFTAVVERVKLVRQQDRDGTEYFETELKLDIPDGLQLRSGLRANADIAVETMYDVLLVPSQAVLDRNTEELPTAAKQSRHVDRARKFSRVVYTLRDGKAVTRPVTIGASDLTRTIITGGVDESERVIVGPFKALLTLKEGQNLKEEEAKKDALSDEKPTEEKQGSD